MNEEFMEIEKVKTKLSKNNAFMYIATACMVFLTIYSLGLRVAIFATGWDLISERFPVFDLYRVSIIGTGVLGLIVIYIYLSRVIACKKNPPSEDKNYCRRKLLNSQFGLILLGALVSWYIIADLFNRDLGVLENLLGTVGIFVTVFTFYLIGKIFDRSVLEFILKRVVLWGTVVWTVGCGISLVMYMINYWGYFKFNGFIRISRQGIMEGRLFGCFDDPNYAAMITVLLIAGMMLLKIRRVYTIPTTVLYLCYIVLSGSRSTYVATLTTAVVLTAIFLYKSRANTIREYVVSIVVVIGALIISYFALMFALQGVGYLITPDRDLQEELIRDDVSLEDISNSRFKIWGGYLELVADRPVTGFGPRGALVYSDEMYPETYLSEKHYNTHSVFLQILVQSGIVGFVLFIVFLTRFFLGLWKGIRSRRLENYGIFFTLMLVWILVYGIFSVFNVGIFVKPCMEAMLVWLSVGWLDDRLGED